MMDITQKSKQMDIDAMTEKLYLSIVAAYVLKASFDTTLFHIPWPGNYDQILRALACAVAFLKICSAKTYAGKEWLICILTGILFKFSWESTEYAFLLDIAMLTIGAINVPYRKIVKTAFWISLYVLLLAMLGSFTGSITDLVYSRATGLFKHSFGIIYPTDFAAHVVFLSLAGWVLYGGNFLILPFFCTLGLAVYVFYYSNAKCSTAILLLHAAAILFFFLTEKSDPGGYQGTPKKCLLVKWGDNVLPWVMPLGALLTIGLTYFYKEGTVWISRINSLLNSRLGLGKAALDTYGVKLFGTAFVLIGAGGNVVTRLDYNFVDISYVLILVRYGLMTLLALCTHYIWLERSALKNGQRKLAIAAALVAVHSMIEHHLPEAAYNLFLLLPFADFSCHKCQSKEKKRPHVAALVIGTAVILALPRAVGYMKTLVDILHLDVPENNILFIGILTAVFITIGACLWIISGIVGAFIRKKPLPKIPCIALPVAVLVLLCAASKGEQIISQGAEEYRDALAADAFAIEALLSSDEPVGRLYIDYIPEIYRREFGNISSRILAAEGAATETDVTLFTEDDQKLKALIYAGFTYGEISPGHAVYTNSVAAEKALEGIGIVLTPYYSRQYMIVPEELAFWNGFSMTDDNRLVLSGAAQSLVHGPGVSIYGGKLRVEYQLQLAESVFGEGLAATAKITSEGGQRILGQGDVNLTDFDENGQCTYAVTMRLYNNYPDVEFLLLIPDGVTLEILGINYGEVE